MKLTKNIDEKAIGKRMILNAIKMEENLTELLRAEVKILKKRTSGEFSYEEIKHINKVIKYILFSLTMTDDKIKTGLELYIDPSIKSEDKYL